MRDLNFKNILFYTSLLISFFFVIILSISIGNENISLFDIFRVDELPKNIKTIIIDLRLPRIILALIVGGGLSISGLCLQTILKNPIASPYTLGISSGSSLLVGIIIIFNITFLGDFLVPFVGFLGGGVMIFIVISLANKLDKGLSSDTIILVGVILSLFVSSILVLITSVSHTEISKIVVWQMGSLSLKGWNYTIILLPFFIISTIGLTLLSKKLDILYLGDEKAKSLGINVKRVKILVIIFTAILTGGAVSVSGIIGFVGLIIPHIIRIIFGYNHTKIIPWSFIFGGIFLLIADNISKIIIYPSEIPIGAITSSIGAPFFIIMFFLRRRKNK